MAVTVHAANLHDTVSGILPATLAFSSYPGIKRFCGDDGYRKTFESNVLETLGLGVDIAKRITPSLRSFPRGGWLSGRSDGSDTRAVCPKIMKYAHATRRP